MITYTHLKRYPSVFVKMTGLRVTEFDALLDDILPQFAAAEAHRLATMTAQTRAREALLPLVMLPIALPVLLAAVRATTGILRGAPQVDWLTWLQLLVVMDALYFGLALLLYGVVEEE
jgi:hypothetical protein